MLFFDYSYSNGPEPPYLNTMTHSIRLAHTSELPSINTIEKNAAMRFAHTPYPQLTHSELLEPSKLQQGITQQLLWVLPYHDRIIGFALLQQMDPQNAYLCEIDIDYDYQGQGFGKALLQQVIEQIASRQYQHLWLITFRTLSFNAPWYQTFGFAITTTDNASPACQHFLNQQRAHEKQTFNVDDQDRVVMCLKL